MFEQHLWELLAATGPITSISQLIGEKRTRFIEEGILGLVRYCFRSFRAVLLGFAVGAAFVYSYSWWTVLIIIRLPENSEDFTLFNWIALALTLFYPYLMVRVLVFFINC